MASRVLVIDDHESARREVSQLLNNSEFELAGESENGPDGLEKYQQLKPDLVIVDIIMPGMDGIETVKRLIELDPKARVVCISSRRLDALVMESLVAGAHEYVDRPLKRDSLIGALKKAQAR